MPKEIKTQPCPECGGEMRYEKHADEVSYLGHVRKIKTLGWWCSRCGEGILDGAALRASEKLSSNSKQRSMESLAPRRSPRSGRSSGSASARRASFSAAALVRSRSTRLESRR